MTDSVKQYLVIVLIFVVSIGGLYLIRPKQTFEPCGILLPAKTTLPATNPDDVRPVASITPDMQQLGQISVRMHAVDPNSRNFPKPMLKKAQQLAASVGANAMYLRIGVPQQNLETGPTWFVIGTALHVS